MNISLLNCKIKRFLCPYCGKWHDWNSRISSIEGQYSSRYISDRYNEFKIYLSCDEISEEEYEAGVYLVIKLAYSEGAGLFLPCIYAKICFKNCCLLVYQSGYDIKEAPDEPRVYLIPKVLKCDKYNCANRKYCKSPRTIQLAFEFDPEEYKQYSTTFYLERLRKEEERLKIEEQELESQLAILKKEAQEKEKTNSQVDESKKIQEEEIQKTSVAKSPKSKKPSTSTKRKKGSNQSQKDKVPTEQPIIQPMKKYSSKRNIIFMKEDSDNE